MGTHELEQHSVERIYLRQWCFDASKLRDAAATTFYTEFTKMSSKFMHAFLSNLANKQTDRHRGQSQLPPPLSEVKYTVVPWVCLPKGPMYFKLDTSKLVSS